MDKMYKIKNRSASVVGYTIPDEGIRRSFMPGETKTISATELEKLTYQSGGREVLLRFLQVQSEEALRDIVGAKVEPEYNMSEEDIRKLVVDGSLDAFLDALDFAPVGVIDLIKKMSITLPLENTAKKMAIKEKLGFDVDAAIKHNIEDKETEGFAATQAPVRRVQPEATSTGRRTAPKYNVVKTEE